MSLEGPVSQLFRGMEATFLAVQADVQGSGQVCKAGSSGGSRGRGRGREARNGAEQEEGGSMHPARLLDREDARHYSGFLGQLSPSEELSMDVPDLLASLLELGGAAPNPAGCKPSPAPSGAPRGHQQQQQSRSGKGYHWGGGNSESAHSAEVAPAPRRGSRSERQGAKGQRGSHQQAVEAGRGSTEQQWEGMEHWDTPTLASSGRRAGDSGSLPLHDAWMQHEGEWAQMHGHRPHVSQVGYDLCCLCASGALTHC